MNKLTLTFKRRQQLKAHFQQLIDRGEHVSVNQRLLDHLEKPVLEGFDYLKRVAYPVFYSWKDKPNELHRIKTEGEQYLCYN